MSKQKSRSGSSINSFLGLAILGAGAYHGYCDAKGIPIQNENLEFAITYGPAIVRGALTATIAGLVGTVAGGAFGAFSGRYSEGLVFKVTKATGGAVLGTITGVVVGGVIGGAIGGVQTLVGYGCGYLAGLATK